VSLHTAGLTSFGAPHEVMGDVCFDGMQGVFFMVLSPVEVVTLRFELKFAIAALVDAAWKTIEIQRLSQRSGVDRYAFFFRVLS
jgi:hypothetical protein